MDPPHYGAPPSTAPGGRPGSRPNWWGPKGRAPSCSEVRASSAPVSQVEVMFHQQYTAQALPRPMEDVKALLATEPTPLWVKHRPKPRAIAKLPRTVRPSRPKGHRPKGREKRSPRSPAAPAPKQEEAVEERTEPRTRPVLPPWLGVHEEHTEGGVQNDIALHVAEKIRHLLEKNSKNFIWIIIESCRDCAHHDSSLRHDESAYKSRCQKLTEAISEKFPEGVQVEMLASDASEVENQVPSEESQADPPTPRTRPSGPNYRIGSLEVYMCCMNPLRPWGAAPLSRRGFGANVLGLCISSKLKSRAWPCCDAVLKRMQLAMPPVPVEVVVQNALGFRIPGVCLNVLSAEQQISQSSTDQNGVVRILVPLFAPITLRAERAQPAVHMERQERILEIVAPDTELTFTAETCIQLWQLETDKELIVFCRDPRMDMEIAVQPIPDLVPFNGSLEYSTGETLRADASGFIRSLGDPLANASGLRVET